MSAKTIRTEAQEEALQSYLRASKLYDEIWASCTNVQLENLRNDLADAYRAMSILTTIRLIDGKSEGITSAMRRTYPELLGPEIGEQP